MFKFEDGQGFGGGQGSDDDRENKFADLMLSFLNHGVRLLVERLYSFVFLLGWMHLTVPIRTMVYWNTLCWFSESEVRRFKHAPAGDDP